MPGLGASLGEDDVWSLIDAIRATNPHRPLAAAAAHNQH
jgi:hypothetical protein